MQDWIPWRYIYMGWSYFANLLNTVIIGEQVKWHFGWRSLVQFDVYLYTGIKFLFIISPQIETHWNSHHTPMNQWSSPIDMSKMTRTCLIVYLGFLLQQMRKLKRDFYWKFRWNGICLIQYYILYNNKENLCHFLVRIAYNCQTPVSNNTHIHTHTLKNNE